ncbi:MAG: hypothetical protein WBG46_13320 [Nonlabens sp.]
MKNIKFLWLLVAVLITVTSCEEDDTSNLVEQIAAPANVDLVFNITQDNTGLVTISPSGENASQFEVFFEDGTQESEVLALGENAERLYNEGIYPVRVVATSLSGLTTEATRDLIVSFRQPENLNVTIVENAGGNNYSVQVSASADFATGFEVTFGEDAAEVPVAFMADEVVDFTYASVGTFDITVTALSGGAATTTFTQSVTILDPIELPLTFESSTINYNLQPFEATVSIVDLPTPVNGFNPSNKAVRLEKTGGQTFGGVNMTVSAPIDFSTQTGVTMRVLSPMPVGTQVTIKFETIVGFGGPANEKNAFTTKVNEWENLYFDFSDIDVNEEWRNIVVFFDLGNAPTGDVNYFDDLQLADSPPVVFPLDFEDDRRQYNIGTNNGSFNIIANPVSGGINTSATVGQFNRPSTGPSNFSLVAIVVDEPLDFSGSPEFKIKIYSPRAGLPVWFKAERVGNNGLFQEDTNVVTTVANGWEELTFNNFSGNATDDLRNIVIFFDPLQATAASEIIYIDDVEQTN